MNRRMLSFLLAQASLGGGMSGVGRAATDGGEPDGSLNRRRERYRVPQAIGPLSSPKELDAIVRARRIAANPIEAERFARAEAKRARKAARRG